MAISSCCVGGSDRRNYCLVLVCRWGRPRATAATIPTTPATYPGPQRGIGSIPRQVGRGTTALPAHGRTTAAIDIASLLAKIMLLLSQKQLRGWKRLVFLVGLQKDTISLWVALCVVCPYYWMLRVHLLVVIYLW